ncbi:MAG: ABC transporter permease [Planctomycetota bacterium]|nr:MAG: ABC transporter permease [Planctomycetota bacterium]
MLVLVGLFAINRVSRVGYIARGTAKEAVRQPVFFLLLGISALILVVYTFLPFFSFGDDVKMLKDCGLVTMLFSGLLLAVWTASIAISQEIEGKTAMTLLSKPVNRRHFIVGKYLGIMQAVVLLMAPLVVLFCLLIYYKVGYDARESAKQVPDLFQPGTFLPNEERLSAVLQILPGILLSFMEVAVLAAVSVAISTRVPTVVNIVTCLAIFVVGHLTPVLVGPGGIQQEFVAFMARLIATVMPSLDSFDTKAAVATGVMVPPVYLLYAAIYCVCYCTAAVFLAFLLFEDRDLA